MTEQEIDILERLKGDAQYPWRKIMQDSAAEITRLRAELAEAREAVGVLAKNLAGFTMHQGIAGQMLCCASDEVMANPTARAALDAARGRVGEAKPSNTKENGA
jgi:hypothetical protein